jgi:hypothetical protein
MDCTKGRFVRAVSASSKSTGVKTGFYRLIRTCWVFCVAANLCFNRGAAAGEYIYLEEESLLFSTSGITALAYELNKGASNYFVDFDFESRNLYPSMFLFGVLFDAPEAEGFYLHGWVGVESPFPYHTIWPGWTDGEAHHMHINMVVTNKTWVLELDSSRTNGPWDVLGYRGQDISYARLLFSSWRVGTPDDSSVQIKIQNLRVGTGDPPLVPALRCPKPLILDCNGGEALGTLNVELRDSSRNQLQVIWTLDGIPEETNIVASLTPGISTNLSFTSRFGYGVHDVGVSASNGQVPPINCSTTVTVRDLAPPQILSIDATPKVLWQVNHRMVPVVINVDAVDSCGPVTSKIISVSTTDANYNSGASQSEWEITGDLTLNLRAERSAKGAARIYTIIIQCEDSVGNKSLGSITVSVPHDNGLH